ncbi:hypothetical protein ACG873_07545 [Mesorhizobium sp. AaZ16]|uniref:hypothetical protein n=1 Tax=Mesorhizobium sp. AaZ16 TaxID=3402289 RepID=UPI00374FAF57
MVQIPAYCEHCGNLFASRLISIQGNVRSLRLSNNKETCPRCGKMASTIDGVFDTADGVMRMLQGPQFSADMLRQFTDLLDKAHVDRLSGDELYQQAAAINPELGKAIAPLRGKSTSVLGIILLIIIAALQSCDFKLEAKVDINQLVDQAVDYLERTEEPDLRTSGSPKQDRLKRTHMPEIDPAAPVSRQVRRQLERQRQKLMRNRARRRS